MLMGHYVSAELDLDKALELNNEQQLLLLDTGEEGNGMDNDATTAVNNERKVILKEKQKLHRLMNQADRNRKLQKKGMEKLFQSREDLYPEKEAPKKAVVAVVDQHDDGDEEEEYQPTTEICTKYIFYQ